MATSRYFRFANDPRHHMSNWRGMSPAAVRRGSRELGSVPLLAEAERVAVGEANFYESSAPPFTRYRPLRKSWDKNLDGAVVDYMRDAREGLSGVAPGGPPLRPSGPEPLDPGEMPDWEPGYPPEPFAMPVGADDDLVTIWEGGTPKVMRRSDVPPTAAEPGFLGLSRNESRLLMIGGVAAVGFFLWKKQKRRR